MPDDANSNNHAREAGVEGMNEHHQKHVEKGRCPSVHRSKAWCNMPAGHSAGGNSEDHYAPYINPPGTPHEKKRPSTYWSDKDAIWPKS